MKIIAKTMYTLIFMHNALAHEAIPALQLLKECSTLALPTTLSLERAATANGYGYIFYKISPLGYDFINNLNLGDKAIEIGAGFSNVTEACIRKGISEYTANDLSFEHLQFLLARLQTNLGENIHKHIHKLLVLPAKAPQELSKKENYYNAMLMDKVMHFMKPNDADQLLNWAYHSLAANGKLYILTISPYSKSYNKGLLAEYEKNKANGVSYPGYIDKMPYWNVSSKDNPQYIIPRYSLFFKLEDLSKKLIENGFQLINSYKLKLPRPESPNWSLVSEEECDLIGITAYKPIS